MNLQKNIKYFLLILVLFGIASPLQAGSDEDAITYRVRVMKGIGSNMGSIGDVLKGKVDHKQLIVHYAKAMNEASKTVTTIFKQDTRTSAKKTRSKPEIWTKWGEFEDAAKKLEDESAKMIAAAQSGDMAKIGAQMKALGDSCGDCHKPFREKKK